MLCWQQCWYWLYLVHRLRISSPAFPPPATSQMIMCACMWQVELALIQRLLPEEILLLIFGKLDAISVAAAQCVCRQWRAVGAGPSLWRAACMGAFPFSTPQENAQLVRLKYRYVYLCLGM
jgi:hypothetical protein